MRLPSFSGHPISADLVLGLPELVTAIPELSPGQIRYTLKQLQTAGIVLMEGRQGQRSTRYRQWPRFG